MAEVSLGNVQFCDRGDYNASTEYKYMNTVLYQGSRYACRSKINSINGILPTDTNSWQLLARGFEDDVADNTQPPDKLVKLLPDYKNSHGNTYNMSVVTENNLIKVIGHSGNNEVPISGGHLFKFTDVGIDPANPLDGNIIKLIQGYVRYFILTDTGKVYGWGWGNSGGLGLGDTANRQYVTLINFFVDNNLFVKDVFVNKNQYNGGECSYFICDSSEEEGVVYGCGYNARGNLGTGHTNNSLIPVKMSGISDVVDISVADSRLTSVCLLDRYGNVYGCGYNGYGQFGIGTTADQHAPVKIFSNAKKVITSSGIPNNSDIATYNWTLILTKDGEIWGSGHGAFGVFGDGSGRSSTSWVRSAIDEIVDIEAANGYYASAYAIKDTGDLYCCGYHVPGGYGDYVNRAAFTKVVGVTDVAKVYLSNGLMGSAHSVVIDKNGHVYTSGYNNQYQTGRPERPDNTNTRSDYARAPMPNLNAKIIEAFPVSNYANTYNYTYLLADDKSLLVAGGNLYGQIGVGHTELYAKTFTQVSL